jgi:glucose/arabinose dehydrogenase
LTRAPVALALLAALLLPSCAKQDASPSPSPTPDPGSCAAGAPVSGTPPLTTVLVAGGLESPVDLQSIPGDRSRIFIVEQAGKIRVFKNGALLSAAFLDLGGQISTGGERGLLGLAFHPLFAQNGRFFVNYTNPSGDTRISEFRANPPSADVADAGSERVLIAQEQPFANHNGGGLAFGSDGMLYIGLGDGGSAGDPLNNGQNLATRLGKILRIDVNNGNPYAVPADNPFAAFPGVGREIWAYGLRNPWRFGFDRATGDLYIGDVGQDRREEIDIGLASRKGGENYGWRITEGSLCFNPSANCGTAGITFPVAEYGHEAGCAVTGGVVYQGCRMPGYHGTYFFGDFCSAFVQSFRFQNGQATDLRDWTSAFSKGIEAIVAFGIDADGEVYIVDHNGELYKIVPAGS